VTHDLATIGKLPGTPEAEARAEFELLLEVDPARACALIKQALAERAATAALQEVAS
jgi:hypothetical protein